MKAQTLRVVKRAARAYRLEPKEVLTGNQPMRTTARRTVMFVLNQLGIPQRVIAYELYRDVTTVQQGVARIAIETKHRPQSNIAVRAAKILAAEREWINGCV